MWIARGVLTWIKFKQYFWQSILLTILLCIAVPTAIAHTTVNSWIGGKPGRVNIDLYQEILQGHFIDNHLPSIIHFNEKEGCYFQNTAHLINMGYLTDYTKDSSLCYRKKQATYYPLLSNRHNCMVQFKQHAAQPPKECSISELNYLGNIFLSINQVSSSISYFNEAIIKAERSQNSEALAVVRANMGYALLRIGDTTNAIKSFNKALLLNIELRNNVGISICFTRLAKLLWDAKKTEQALFLPYNTLIKLTGLSRTDSISMFTTLAYSYLSKQQYKCSLASAKIALDLAQKNNSKEELSSTLNTLSVIYKNIGNKSVYDKLLKEVNSTKIKNEIAGEYYTPCEIDQREAKIKQLITLNQQKEEANSQNEQTLIVVIICSTLLLLTIFFLSKKITAKAIQNSAEIEMRLRRSQLNPHFIYNSLNSIQKFIWANNPEQASIYLSNFSTLMRKTLECLRQDEVLLSKEIEILKIYLDLEKQRLKNGFEYKIETAPNVKPDEIKITPMLIQPFIENAIWHGLAPLPQGSIGVLTILYTRNKKFLIPIVEDNGVGINQSLKNKISSSQPHFSTGITISLEQLKLSYKKRNIQFCHDITITDKSEISPDSHGTIISLSIPIIDLF